MPHLQPVLEHGTIALIKNLLSDLDDKVRPNPHNIPIIGGMVNLT